MYTSVVNTSTDSDVLQTFSLVCRFAIDAFITVCHVQETILLMMLLVHTAYILQQIQSALNRVKIKHNTE